MSEANEETNRPLLDAVGHSILWRITRRCPLSGHDHTQCDELP